MAEVKKWTPEEIIDEVYNQETDEVVNMVNRHSMAREEADNRTTLTDLKARMQTVISRISGSNKVSKKTITRLSFGTGESYFIRKSNGELVGTIGINRGKLQSKLVVVNKRPVFVLYRDNEIFLKQDVLSGETAQGIQSGRDLMANMEALEKNAPMLEATREIYNLIDQADFLTLDAYITHSMEKLIQNADVDTAQKANRDAYIKVQVLYRNIIKIKTVLLGGGDYAGSRAELMSQMDILYRQICEILINMGLYEVPKNPNELITRG